MTNKTQVFTKTFGMVVEVNTRPTTQILDGHKVVEQELPQYLHHWKWSHLKKCIDQFFMLMVLFPTQDVLNAVTLEITVMMIISDPNLKPIGIQITISVQKPVDKQLVTCYNM